MTRCFALTLALITAVAIGALVFAWVAVRTVFGDMGRAYLAWVVASSALILISPRAGLILYIVTGAFFDDVQFSQVGKGRRGLAAKRDPPPAKRRLTCQR